MSSRVAQPSQSPSPNLLSLAEANNHLGFNLYKLMAKDGKNVFFSPFSISTALAMLFCGSAHETAQEMRQVLGYETAGLKDDSLKTCFQQLLNILEKNQKFYTISCANAVLSHKKFAVKYEFKTLLKEYFKALLQEVDFEGDSSRTVKRINDFVFKKTKGMIPKLVDSLDSSTVMVILNAVYFKGSWLWKFDEKSTCLQKFYNNGDKDNSKQVDMMHIKKEFPYVERESFKALELPYKGKRISMLILLPNSTDGLTELENNLTLNFIKDLKQEMHEQEVEVALPKFRLEYSKPLKETFQILGMNRLFEIGAHFDGISDSKELAISEIFHKAVVVVNEEGTVAAASTAYVMMAYSFTYVPEFIVDHPFMFIIYNTKNNLVYFMGKAQQNQSCSPRILELAEANNHLGFNLYKLLAKEEKNVFFSPFSISTALAMLFCGSAHETAEEMRQVLGYEAANIKDDSLKTCFQQLLNVLENSQESYTISCANSVLSHKEFAVKEEFKTLLEEYFKALLQEVDFKNDSSKAVKMVNDFVHEKTKGMIPQLVDSLDSSTVMVILNAVYFKGSWLRKFNEKSTFLQYFYNNGDKDNYKQVDMMHIKKDFRYVEKESFKALELPYKGDEISMLVLLPNSQDGLTELENKVNLNFIQDLKQEMHERRVEVALPKFRLEYSKSLKQTFQSLGMNRLFQNGAHFDGISDSKELAVSQIIHKAVVVVNEEGTEAAAATAVVMMMCSLTFDPEFIVDHPFMFIIYNTKNNLVYFMGRVDEL